MSATTIPRSLHCARCGDDRPPRTICSRCGGSGMVTGAYGDPTECSACGYSGLVWPPRCLTCGGFRKWAERD